MLLPCRGACETADLWVDPDVGTRTQHGSALRVLRRKAPAL